VEAVLTREQVYLTIVEGWLRDNRGIVFTEGAVDDLCGRIAAEITKLKDEVATCRELRQYDRLEIERLRFLFDKGRP